MLFPESAILLIMEVDGLTRDSVGPVYVNYIALLFNVIFQAADAIFTCPQSDSISLSSSDDEGIGTTSGIGAADGYILCVAYNYYNYSSQYFSISLLFIRGDREIIDIDAVSNCSPDSLPAVNLVFSCVSILYLYCLI